jgi:hypothetical protein
MTSSNRAPQSDEHKSHLDLRSFLSKFDDKLVCNCEYDDIRSADRLAALCAISLSVIGTALLTFLSDIRTHNHYIISCFSKFTEYSKKKSHSCVNLAG